MKKGSLVIDRLALKFLKKIFRCHDVLNYKKIRIMGVIIFPVVLCENERRMMEKQELMLLNTNILECHV